jgi:deoxyadenosine/deoxycytidine kinase
MVVYLRASVPTLSERITYRDREYEREITPTYLAQLHELYEAWIADFTLCPVLTVPADDLDFVTHPNHLDLIVKKVEEKLTGKEEVRFEPGEISPP